MQRFTVNVTQSRVLLLVLNVVLAVGVFAVALANMAKKRGDAAVKVVDREQFAYEEIELSVVPGPERVRPAADQLQPKPPPPPPVRNPLDSGDVADVDDDPAEPEPGGPLEEANWAFDQYLINKNRPFMTQITLKKEEENAAVGTNRGRGGRSSVRPARGRGNRSRGATRGSRGNRGGARAGRGAKGAQGRDDRITFYLYERKFEVPGLDEKTFYVHAVDASKFIYWEAEEGPESMYLMRFKQPTFYAEQLENGEVAKLAPRPKDPEAEEDDAEEKPVQHFQKRPVSWRDDREAEYEDLLQGRIRPDQATHFKTSTRPSSAAAGDRGSRGQRTNRRGASAQSGDARKTNERAGGSGRTTIRRTPPTRKSPTRRSPQKSPASDKSSSESGEAKAPMSKAEGLREIGNILGEAEKQGKLTSEKDRKAAEELKQLLGRPKRGPTPGQAPE